MGPHESWGKGGPVLGSMTLFRFVGGGVDEGEQNGYVGAN